MKNEKMAQIVSMYSSIYLLEHSKPVQQDPMWRVQARYNQND